MNFVTKMTKSLAISLLVMAALITTSNTDDSHFFVPESSEPALHDVASRYGTFSPEELLDLCQGINSVSRIGQDCFELLHQHFSSDPVWVASRALHHIGDRSSPMPSSLNVRSSRLRFEYDDYAMNALPLWKDIFDGSVRTRLAEVRQVLEQEECRKLTNQDGGLVSELASACNARELVKYAMLLDACVTAIERQSKLSFKRVVVPPGESLTDELAAMAKSSFEHGLARIDERWGQSNHRRIAREEYIIANLRSAWVSKLCSNGANPVTALVNERAIPVTPAGVQPGRTLTLTEMAKFVKPTFHMLMQIAARTGDEWAVVSYYPRGEDKQYFIDLYAIKPILVHRWLSTWIGKSFGLSDMDRRQHRLEFLSMLEATYPDSPRLHRKLDQGLSGFSELELINRGKSLVFPWDSKTTADSPQSKDD